MTVGRKAGVRAGMALAAAIAGVLLVTALPAGATGAKPATGAGPKPPRSTTVEYTLPVPALVLENLCNADTVVLNGDLYIRTTTTPQRNGAVTVVSTINGRNLTGFGLPSALDYTGEDREYTYSYTAPPPGLGTFEVVQYTKLMPQGNAPTMYLVVVLREVVTPTGAVPTLERAYLVCQQPKPSCKKV